MICSSPGKRALCFQVSPIPEFVSFLSVTWSLKCCICLGCKQSCCYCKAVPVSCNDTSENPCTEPDKDHVSLKLE